MAGNGIGNGNSPKNPKRTNGSGRTHFLDSHNMKEKLSNSISKRGWDYTDIISEGASRPFRLVLLAFVLLAIVFLFRLLYLQVIVADDYTAHAEESRTRSYEVTPHRGTIYDRNGVVLAISVDSTTIYCDPTEVEDVSSAAAQLAEVLGGEADEYREKLTTPKTTFVYIKRQADVEKADILKERDIPGIYFIEDSRREYPNGSIGGQVIGVCDVDGNGITGLELQYDDILRGTPGKYSAERGRKGTPIPGAVHEDTVAINGQDIMVSLDIKLQDSVEQALQRGVQTYEGKKGNSVVMDADTGEIYAICSVPYLNPSNLEESEIGSDNLTAITQGFEPGSIFKSVSALGILQAGGVDPEDEIWCPNIIYADDYGIKDAHDRPDVNMSFNQILWDSSNVGISLLTEKVGFDKLYDVIKAAELDKQTGVDYPGEAVTTVPDFGTWGKIVGYNISFGQGLTATPLQMTRFYGALANGGTLVTPHFLISKPQTDEWIEYESKKVLNDTKSIDTLNEMLKGVVDNGTGKKAAIEGYDVVGKTSTAQIAENGEYAESLYNLCFVGFIDNSNSNLVCFASANEIIYEGDVATVFHDIMVDAIDQYNIVPN